MTDKLISAVERFFTALRETRQLGAGTKETSYYPAFSQLLNVVGTDLKPRVLCLSQLENVGAGSPDFGLFAATQVQKGEPRKGQLPERGVVEMKGVADETWITADTKQVTKYFDTYRLVLVSNLRDFLLIGEGPGGRAVRLESFRLANSPAAFWSLVDTPRKSAAKYGAAFAEYLRRALTQSVSLREPMDVAWFLASYARDALARVEAAGGLAALTAVRNSLEQALGVHFEEERGDRFFRSTLVQTLFYGVFSAWVLWSRQKPTPTGAFDWRTAAWTLHVPFIRTLFEQLSAPTRLQPLGLVEVLDWTTATLNRVDRAAFFGRFSDADAVQYFYEPFLEAFDPALRKELGVWYTPPEVVDYMVARVDHALQDDLGLPEGLASEQVYVLDPCCGTGAYLSAVLRRIDRRLDTSGLGALRGAKVREAALGRVFGFEIMPAPFVVAHLQIGLALDALGAPLDAEERAGIYLTNALTGWEPVESKPLPLAELEEERSRADEVKRDKRILVIFGNPPYNGHPGVAQTEDERALTSAYRTTKRVRAPEGRGLNDLYVRFFRMAERRIAECTGEGVVCFISNYSWLDGLSFTGMREALLERFDAVRVDVLNGDKYKTGKTTPEGEPDPSIFSTEHNREGIQVGTAITTLVRRSNHTSASSVDHRSLWGTDKREQLMASAEANAASLYAPHRPMLTLGLPFAPTQTGADYDAWPKLIELMPTFSPGIQTSRDDFLVDISRAILVDRLVTYLDPERSDEAVRAMYPQIMSPAARFNPISTRKHLLQRNWTGVIRRYAYRPYDSRWVYLEPETKLLNEKRLDYWDHVSPNNPTLVTQQRPRDSWNGAQIVNAIGCLDLVDRGSSCFPQYVNEIGVGVRRPNLSKSVLDFLTARDLPPEAVFQHVTATLHAPAYRAENAGALRLDWPRAPLPSDRDALAASAALGAELAVLLDPERPASGATVTPLRPGLRTLATPARRDGAPFGPSDLTLAAGWGSAQTGKAGRIVMPGRGRTTERDYTDAERAALSAEGEALGLSLQQVLVLLGERTRDVHLNADAWWANIPERVWAYELGGYQVLKKWLSYREHGVLGRPLISDEALHVSHTVRRIAAILLLGPRLDAAYAASKASAVLWKEGRPVDPLATASAVGEPSALGLAHIS